MKHHGFALLGSVRFHGQDLAWSLFFFAAYSLWKRCDVFSILNAAPCSEMSHILWLSACLLFCAPTCSVLPSPIFPLRVAEWGTRWSARKASCACCLYEPEHGFIWLLLFLWMGKMISEFCHKPAWVVVVEAPLSFALSSAVKANVKQVPWFWLVCWKCVSH